MKEEKDILLKENDISIKLDENEDYSEIIGKKIIYPSNYFYQLFFYWIFSSLRESKKNQLNLNNLNNISNKYESEQFFNEIFKIWKFKTKNSFLPLITSIIYSNLIRFIVVLILGIIISLLEILFTFLFKELLVYFQGEKWRKAKFGGTNLIILMLISKFIYIFIYHHKEFQTDLLSSKITIQINTLIYNKIYKAKMYLKEIPSFGRLIDLIENDSEYFGDFISNFTIILVIPFQIGYYFYVLFISLGKAFIIGFFIFIIVIIIVIIIQIKIKNIQRLYMKSKDARIQISSKLFYNIRNIKLNSLEEIYAEKINEKRLNEIKYFSKLQYLQLLLNSIQFSLPPIVSVISILFYRLNIFNETREEEKEMSDTLSDINIFYQITLLIFTLPDFFISLFNNLVSIKRLEEFLFFEEIFEYKNENNFSIDDISISMNNCNFGIKKDNLILLNNINIEIKKGELIGICGNIGSGKSNFLNAIINNLDLLEISENDTNIKINGKIHYIPQIPFIINDTCLNNLIFHKKYLKERYKKIVDICQLEEDFLMMKGGDNNEIGESGYNLSSGQKSRISIARGFYSNDDILLFDDIFNVLDINIGLLIFQKGIKEYLKDKTRLIVTNSLQYLQLTDKIIYFEKGKMIFYNNYKEFTKSDIFNKMNIEKDSRDKTLEEKIYENNEFEDINIDNNINLENEKSEINKLVLDEPQKKGLIAFDIIKSYIMCTGGIIIFILLLFGHLILKSFELGKEYYSSIIEEDEEEDNFWNNLIILSIITFCGRIINFFVEFISVKAIIKCNINIHDILIKNLINAPINTFHDVIPREQIINRLNGDLYNTVNLVIITNKTFRMIFQVIGCLIIFGNFSYIILIITPFIILLEILLMRFYLHGGRDLNRLEGVSRSPIIKIFSENLNGLKIIKCSQYYKKIYIDKFYQVLNQYFKIKIFKSGGQNWFGVHLNLLTYLLLVSILLLCLYFKNNLAPYKIGLILSYSLDLNDFLYNTMNRLSRFEKLLTSIERCKSFMNITSENFNNINKNIQNFHIKFINFSVKYRPNCNYVLNNINLVINEREKIAIIGRTGSGKTTLCLSLFRIFEEFEGKLLINNIDIRDINLKSLRKLITFIPQEPFIFEGTIKECIDPYNEYDENDIIECINNIGLNYLINSEYKIMNKIGDNDIKLSIGEKQLLCLCRALLTKSRIIILDEPYSNMDKNYENLLNNCINKYLSFSTLITISHKIDSILNYDKIIVIDKGNIVEFDTPNNLISKEDGLFRKYYLKYFYNNKN